MPKIPDFINTTFADRSEEGSRETLTKISSLTPETIPTSASEAVEAILAELTANPVVQLSIDENRFFTARRFIDLEDAIDLAAWAIGEHVGQIIYIIFAMNSQVKRSEEIVVNDGQRITFPNHETVRSSEISIDFIYHGAPVHVSIPVPNSR